jgi:hypothetical protein
MLEWSGVSVCQAEKKPERWEWRKARAEGREA